MPVNSTHPDYDANATAWARARAVVAGEDAVKAAGERYLPRLESQSSDEYQAYKGRASFFNATARTLDGFVGLIFRRGRNKKQTGAQMVQKRCKKLLRSLASDENDAVRARNNAPLPGFPTASYRSARTERLDAVSNFHALGMEVAGGRW